MRRFLVNWNRLRFPVLKAGLAVLAILLLASTAHAANTLDNLQAAFQGETNAHARYLEFAQQADKEGYGAVASLFRAAAKAEAIHASNHAVAIRKLGAMPKAAVDHIEVKSTEQNLQAAIQGESYERDTMYPGFLKQARVEGNTDAVRTFNLAKTAEAEHAKLYAAALQNLTQLKGSKETSYYVCGYTTREVSFSKCPSCFSPKEKFEKVV
jgi:rubrerythrin